MKILLDSNKLDFNSELSSGGSIFSYPGSGSGHGLLNKLFHVFLILSVVVIRLHPILYDSVVPWFSDWRPGGLLFSFRSYPITDYLLVTSDKFELPFD